MQTENYSHDSITLLPLHYSEKVEWIEWWWNKQEEKKKIDKGNLSVLCFRKYLTTVMSELVAKKFKEIVQRKVNAVVIFLQSIYCYCCNGF